MVVWPSRCHCHSLSLAPVYQIVFTFLVLPFWYQLTRVVLDKIQKSCKTIVVVIVVWRTKDAVIFRRECLALSRSQS